jgi:DNA polymerase IV
VVVKAPRIACVHLPHVATAIEARDNIALVGRPLVIEAPQPGPCMVYDLSYTAQLAGVTRGMSLTQARRACPELTVLPARPDIYRDTLQVLLALLADLTPAVEPVDLERSWFTATGLAAQGGTERALAEALIDRVGHETGLNSQVGLAHGKLTSQIVTQYIEQRRVMVLPAGKEVTFLAGLATRYLPLSEPNHRRLNQLGLTKIHQFAMLPAAGILPRFGYEGLRAFKLAHGQDDAQVRPWQAEPFLEAAHVFEEPIANRRSLQYRLEQLAYQVARPLAAQFQMAGALSLTVTFANGQTATRQRTLVEPAVQPRILLNHADALMADIAWGAPVERVVLAAQGLCPTVGRQLTLFRQAHEDDAEVEVTLRRIQAKYGPIVQQGHLLEPGAPLPERRAYLAPWGAA